jgi:hypothetical protein
MENIPINIPINKIKTDGGTQPRAQLDFITIGEYAEAMKSGDDFPPIVVFYDGEVYWLADGFHRLEGARQAGLAEIRADVRQGTLREAILYSTGANASHGLRRSNDDKRRAVLRLLEDSEWTQWSDREVARRTSTSAPFVAAIRATVNIYSDVRKTADGRVMNTANIGAKPGQAVLESTVPAQSFMADRVRGGNSFGDIAGVAAAVLGSSETPADPALLKPVEELEATVERDAFGVPYNNPTSLAEEEPVPAWLQDEDAHEDGPDDEEAEQEDPGNDDGEERTQTLQSETQEPVRPAEPAPFPPSPPVGAKPAALPAPVIREAAWVLSISVPAGAPPLVTILHGALPMVALPGEVAERVITGIRAKVEPPAPVVVSDGDKEWLEVN